MILYVVSFTNADEIEKAISESGKSILDKKVENNFDITSYMKQQIDQLQPIDTLLIDLSALNNADDEIIKSISNFRILYNETQIIIIDLNRTVGDRLLSEIFCMGIYDIIAGIEKDQLEDEITYCLNNKKTYRESLIYKMSEKTNVNQGTTLVKEKIIIKNEIRTAVNKTFLGFIGTQERIGVTHNAIVCANYLKNKGFKVAIIEEQSNENKCFSYILDSFDLSTETEFFNINQIDYYPNYDIKNSFKILSKNYNFILVDFGVFREDKISEFNRCVIPIIITGTKPWEIEKINKIFESVEENELKEYTYFFNFCDIATEDHVRECMGDIKKIYFSEYNPDPFNAKNYDSLDNLFKDYLPETITKKQEKFNIRELYEKTKCKLNFSK